MSKYNNVSDFLYDLKQKYPERLISLLDVDYTEDELLNYVEHKSVDDFYPQLFRDVLVLKRTLLMNESNLLTSFHGHNQTPIKGEMSLDKSTGLLSVFDGSIWINIQN
jgi:hypothetical protein